MASSTDNKLAAVDALLDLFPFFRCPHCNSRATGDLILLFDYTGSLPVKPDNPTKTFQGSASQVETSDWQNIRLYCDNCDHESPVPEGWTWIVK